MTKSSTHRFSPEVRERAVRLVLEQAKEHSSQWAAITAVAPKLGCTKETLRRWVREAERETGQRPGPTRAEEDRLKTLERENRELRRTNEILRKASAYFAQADAPVPDARPSNRSRPRRDTFREGVQLRRIWLGDQVSCRRITPGTGRQIVSPEWRAAATDVPRSRNGLVRLL